LLQTGNHARLCKFRMLEVVMRWMTVRTEMNTGPHPATKTGRRLALMNGKMRMSNINKRRMRLRQQTQKIHVDRDKEW
jgi:hypothetical protein